MRQTMSRLGLLAVAIFAITGELFLWRSIKDLSQIRDKKTVDVLVGEMGAATCVERIKPEEDLPV